MISVLGYAVTGLRECLWISALLYTELFRGGRYEINANLASFWLLLQAVTIPGLADRIRKSVALAFNSRGEVVHLELLVGNPLL